MNELLIRARKESEFSTQRELGTAVATHLHGDKISANYAQKKVSLWESLQLIPTPQEMEVISELLKLPIKELKESFSGVLPFSTADLIRGLSGTGGEALIASCFTGRVRVSLLEEDEEALREAINHRVSIAIFFPFTAHSGSSAKPEYAEGLTAHHREAWRSIVKFWKVLRSLGEESVQRVKLFRPRLETGANVLFPPIFHRPTLVCERAMGRTTIDLYTWTQEPNLDGFYRITGRSLESTEVQAEAWELFYGDVFAHWAESGELADGDSYWQAYSSPSNTEGEN